MSRPADIGDVAVLRHDGSPYQRYVGGLPNQAPRAAAARAFFTSHRDAYDFLIVFPTFAHDLSDAATGGETLGLHTLVRNDVTGIGTPVGDGGGAFGSAALLKGYIDVNSLVPGVVDSSFDSALGVIAHEIAHQWSGRASFIDPATGMASLDLLGQEQAHWSFFLDSDASVLYGSNWQASSADSFSALESKRRYSALDLYLMGFAAPSEVAPFKLIRPAGGSHSSTDVPPPDGTVVHGTAQDVTIDQLIQAMGPRNPDSSRAQTTFRAAFALLVGPGQQATPAQVAFVDSLRREWANRFFFMTQGRAVMEADLVEASPGIVASNPSVQLGLGYLLGAQRSDGSWGDDGPGAVRETQSALEALALFRSQSGVGEALSDGAAYLASLQPIDVDTSARRDLGSRAAVLGWIPSGAAAHDLSRANADGGMGLASGYGSSIVDTLLAALAARNPLPADLAVATSFLIQNQNTDGGWSWLVGSASDLRATALALQVLATLEGTLLTVDAGASFLAMHRSPTGEYRDDLTGDNATADAVLALDGWQRLGPDDARESADALLAAQQEDGSWYGSPYETAQALKALRHLTLPDLAISPAEVALTSTNPTEGETVQARLVVRSTGHADASQVAVRAYDSSGQPFGPAVVVPNIAAGSASVVHLSLDTLGHANSAQVFLVVDPDGLIDETRKNNNRATVAMTVTPRPEQPDLFVASGSLVASPGSISRVATAVTVTARVGNLGRTDVPAATVALLSGGTQIASTSAAFPATSDQVITLGGTLPAAAGAAALQVVVDPQSAVSEAREDNNTAQTALTVVPTVDLAVSQVNVSPNPVDQGRDAVIQFHVANRGTTDALPGTATVTILDATGGVLAALPGVPLTIPSGGMSTGRVAWRANSAAAATVRVEMAYPGDLDPSDNSGTALLGVNTSGLPNLLVKAGGLSIQPSPPLEGQSATVTAVVRNGGNSAAGAFAVDLWSGDPAQGGTRAGRALVPALSADAETSIALPFTPSSGDQTALIAVVDPDSQVSEFDESDNTSVLTVQPLSRPDLAITSPDIQPQTLFPKGGDQVPVTVSIANLGRQGAGPFVVQLVQGEPEAGGVLIGTVAVPGVPAQGRADASFIWRVADSSGTVVLVAIANPDHAAVESRYDNDRAERAVAIQSDAMALSNPYFSPNGDGVKDRTEILYHLPQPAPVEVIIADERGRVVRTLSDSSGNAAEGSLTWDGRSNGGAVVRDGVYRASVTSGGQPIAAVEAVVDTNRTSILDAPRNLVASTSIDAVVERTLHPPLQYAGIPDYRVVFAGSTQDEQGLVLHYSSYGWNGYTYAWHCGFYRFPVDGGDPVPLSPEWGPNYDPFCEISVARVTPDDGSILFLQSRALYRLTVATRTVTLLASTGMDGSVLSRDSLAISPDGRTAFVRSVQRRVAIDIESGAMRDAGRVPYGAVSPDGSLVAVTREDGLHVSNVDGSGDRLVAIPKPVPGCLQWDCVGGEVCDCLRVDPTPISIPPGVTVLPEGGHVTEFAWVSQTEMALIVDAYSLVVPEVWLLDLVDGESQTLPLPGFSYLSRLTVDPAGEHVTFVLDGTQLWSASVDASLPSLVHDWASTGLYSVAEEAFSREGSFLYVGNEYSRVFQALHHLGNLTVQLSAYRRPSSTSLVFRGTAADLNLESWELTARRSANGEEIVVARGVTPIMGGELAQWTPPEAGTWQATLTARDKAGNARSVTTLASWAEVPAIADLRLDPKQFSPNGDGHQDATTLTYSVQQPISTQLLVKDAAGNTVRTIPITHAAGGSSSVVWDGKDDGGTTVADGSYDLSLEAQRVGVIVDDAAPAATLALSGNEPEDAFGTDLFVYDAYEAEDTSACIQVPLTQRQLDEHPLPAASLPLLTVNLRYSVRDDHLAGWALEANLGASQTGFEAFTTSTNSVDDEDVATIPLVLIPGTAIRLNARDQAGNETKTAAVDIPEAARVVGWGPGQYATWCLGQALPKLRPSGLTYGAGIGNVYAPGAALPHAQALPLGLTRYFRTDVTAERLDGFCFEPAFHGFWVQHTIRQPLVAASIAHRPRGTAAWSVDQTNVELTDAGVVTWDARGVPGLREEDEFEVRLIDVSGREYASPVPVCRRPPQFASADLCSHQAAYDGSDAHLRIAGPKLDVEEAVLGLVFALRDHATGVDYPLQVSESRDDSMYWGDPSIPALVIDYVAHVDPDVLPGCEYELVDARGDGRALASLDVCGVRLEHVEMHGDMATLNLHARYRKLISSVDVSVGAGEQKVYAGTIPAFQNVSRALDADLSGFACDTEVPITATVHFADGSTSHAGVLEHGACGPASLRRSCMSVSASTSRESTPLCAGQPADYRVTASAASQTGTVASLTVRARPQNGIEPTVLGTTGFVPGPHASAAARFTSSAYAEGTWLIDAVATDDAGATAISTPTPVVVDRTPPSLQLRAPLEGAVVCPLQQPDGMRVVRVDGVAEAPSLGAYSFLLRCGSGDLLPVARVPLAGSLGAFDVTRQPSADCSLALEARNGGGGSWCTAPVHFHLVNGSGVSAAPMSSLLSPNGDGVLDQIVLQISPRESSSVTVTATDAANRSGVVWQGPMPAGPSSVSWDGTIGGIVAADGVAKLQVDAIDPCGQRASTTALALVDTALPVVRIDAPTAGARVGGLALIAGEVSDQGGLDRYQISIGAGAAPTAYQVVLASTAPAVGPLGAVPTAGLPEGIYTVRLWARDLAGNEADASVQVAVAPKQLIAMFAVAPALVSPNDDGVLDGATASFQLLAASTVSMDLLDRAGSVVAPLAPAVPAMTGQTDWVIPPAVLAGLPQDDDYQVRLTATAPGMSEAETALLVIDRGDPTLAIRSPSDHGVVPGSADVTGSARDQHLDSWTLSFTTGVAPAMVVATGRASVDGYLARLENLPEGDHRLLLDARDHAGNAAHVEVAFASDTTPPVAALLAPSEGASLTGRQAPVSVLADVRDAHLAQVRLSVTSAGAPARELFSGPALPSGGVTWEVGGEPDGRADLTLIAVDAAGNESQAHRAVIIDSTEPVAAIASPRGGYLRAGDAIRGTATDANLASWTLDLASGPSSLAAIWTPLASGTGQVSDGVLTTLASLPADGLYALRLTVADLAGNTSQDTAAFLVDTTPPRPPPSLAAQVSGGDVLLTWGASPDGDVVGYQVMRATGVANPVPVGAPVSASAFTDTGVAEGTYHYVVIAVDGAGLQSPPSPMASATVDCTPPTVAIDRPQSGAGVAGALRVTGTAWSPTDFKEYRLSIGAGAAPAAFTLVRRSGVPVVAGELSSIDAGSLVDGSAQTIRLEAEDLNGNVGEARVTVHVDTTPPAAPVLVSATPDGSSVALLWQPGPDTDLAGFVVYRNGSVANAPVDVPFGDIASYRLPAASLSYADPGLPDGTYTYDVQAFDQAGNPSPLSNSLTVTLQAHAPRAVITAPANLARLSTSVDVVADAADQDVASVQFQVRDGSAASFQALGDPVTRIPFTARLDPSAFMGPVLELRAVATDRSGATDPSPASLFVFVAPSLQAPSVTARVTGDEVDLSWIDPNPGGAVSGHTIERDGLSLVPAVPRPTGTPTSTDPTSQPGRAYDGLTGSAWSSRAATPGWQLDLASPVVASQVELSLYMTSEIEVALNMRGVWVSVHHAAESGTVVVPLGDGLEISGCRVRFLTAPSGVVGLYEVTITRVPLVSGLALHDGPLALGEHEYTVRTVTPFGVHAEGTATANVYEPLLAAPPTVVASSPLAVTGSAAAPGSSVALLRGGTDVGQAQAAADGTFAADVDLIEGTNTFVALATDARGNVSLPSAPVTTVYDAAPSVELTLSLAGVSGPDVALSFVTSGGTSRVASFTLTRSSGGVSTTAATLGPADRAAVDRGLPNGEYTYTLVAVNDHGVRGAVSNPVTAVVGVPLLPAPSGLVVSPAASGGALRLDWTYVGPPASAFLVERASSASGPFESANATAPSQVTTYFDRGLVGAVPYYYRVRALDAAGNVSAPSEVASGVPLGVDAPARPRIVAPTTPGWPLHASQSFATVEGFADPGVTVELRRNGVWVDAAQAGQFEFASRRVSRSTAGAGGASADGRMTAVATGARLDVQRPDGSVTVADPAVASFGRVVFSPDGGTIAFEGVTTADARHHVWIASTSDGTLRRATSVDGEEWAPAWSPDGARLAYEATRPSFSSRVVGVLTVSDGVESVLAQTGRDVREPAWTASGLVLALASAANGPGLLVAFDDDGVAREILSSPAPLRELTVSPAGDLAAFREDGASPRVLLVDISSGIPAEVPGSGNAVHPVFVRGSLAIAWMSDSQFVVWKMGEGAPTLLDLVFAARLISTDAGVYAFTTGEMRLLQWGGRFQFPTTLETGENEFAAIAEDGAGHRSAASEPISVTLDAAYLPDLAITVWTQPRLPAKGDPVNAVVTIRNGGQASWQTTEVEVRVAGDDGSLRATAPVQVGPLAAGASTTALVPLDVTGLVGSERLTAIVDPWERVEDADRSNNTATVEFQIASARAIGVTASASPASVRAGESTTATVAVANPGMPQDVTVRTRIADSSGATVVEAPEGSYAPLPGGATTTFTRPLAVGSALAGAYQVLAEVVANGSVVAHASAPLTVEPDREVGLTLVSARASYPGDVAVELEGRVENHSTNSQLVGAVYRLEIDDAQGMAVFSAPDASVPPLWLGARAALATEVPAGVLSAGHYTADASVVLDGAELARATAAFTVAGRAALSGTVLVQGANEPPAVPVGQDAVVTYALANDGNATSLEVACRVVLVDPDTLAVIADQQLGVGDLPPSQAISGEVRLTTSGLPLEVYAVSLVADHDGESDDVLATTRFRLADAMPPALALQNVSSGMFVRGTVTPVVHASDDHSGTALVQVSVDGHVPVPLALTSGVALEGNWSTSLPLGADGAHALVFSAIDVEGNSGLVTPTLANPVAVQIVNDTVPPVVAVSGVAEGTCYAAPPLPVATASDLNLAVVDTRLDGVPFTSGRPVTADGDHSLSIQATDRAGNQATSLVHFTVDQTPPRIYVSGASEGACIATDVRYTVTAVDSHLTALNVAVNGVAGSPTATLSAEGAYAVAAHATDCAGNASDAALHFTIDRTPPVLSVGGVADGAYYRTDVTPSWASNDANLATVVGTLNGLPFSSGTIVSADGEYLLEVAAVDRAGNRAERTVAFVVDRTAPSVTLSGFVDGSYVNSDVSPAYSVSDADLERVEATLDLLPFVPGMNASSEGFHVFTVKAYDRAGNETERSGTFTIDRTPPVVSLSGFVDGSHVTSDVSPVYSASDAHLDRVEASLDGQPFQSGAVVTAEGSYRFDVVALDRAANRTERSGTFTIDRTPPAITISGVEDGAQYGGAVVPVIAITDLYLSRTEVALNGAPFVSGTSVTQDGSYALRARGEDRAGNAAERSMSFTIRASQFHLDKRLAGRFARILALVKGGSCHEGEHGSDRVREFLERYLGGSGRLLRVTGDEETFLAEMRSGLYNVMLLLEVDGHPDNDGDDHEPGCGPCHGRDGDEEWGHDASPRREPYWAAKEIEKLTARELTELVFAGKAGAIVVRPHPADAPELRELLGADLYGHASHGSVRFSEAPIGPLADLTLGGDGTRLKLYAASAAGFYVSSSSGSHKSSCHPDKPEVAAAKQELGLGRSVLFGFDLAQANLEEDAGLALRRAVDWVAPADALSPLAVAGMELALADGDLESELRIHESLETPLLALVAVPAATVDLARTSLEWTLAAHDPTKLLRYYARLPDQIGSYTTTTEVTAVRPGGTQVLGTFELELAVAETGNGLLEDARSAAALLPRSGHDGQIRRRIEGELAQVAARPIHCRRDIEKNLEDLFDALGSASNLESVSPTAMRFALDELVRYWEARWYVY